MNNLSRLFVPLLVSVVAIGLAPETSEARNPVVKTGWQMPKAGAPGNAGPNDCDPQLLDQTNLRFGNCFNQNTLLLRLTGALDGQHPKNSFMGFLENIIDRKLLRAEDDTFTATPLFSNFIDLTLKRLLDDTDSTVVIDGVIYNQPKGTVDYDPNNFVYRPVTANTAGATWLGGYDAAPLLDACMDVPLVGSVCLNGYLYDVDNDFLPGIGGGRFFSYNHLNSSFSLLPQVNEDVESEFMTGSPASCVGAGCGVMGSVPAEHRDDDDGLEITLSMRNVIIDLLFEPPARWSLTDIASSTENYEPADDLSSYLKAYGQAELGTVELSLNIRLAADYNDSVEPAVIGIGIELQDVEFLSDFRFVFQKGPYCNNNLGTTETQPGTVGYTNPAARPFSNVTPFGPNYPGLISDTVTGTNPGAPLLQYFSMVPATRPTVASNDRGGSGIGRDRIGVGAAPYEFNPTDGPYSDNPNNCMRPADAC